MGEPIEALCTVCGIRHGMPMCPPQCTCGALPTLDGSPTPHKATCQALRRGQCTYCFGSGETVELHDVGVGNMERRETCGICRGTGKAAP